MLTYILQGCSSENNGFHCAGRVSRSAHHFEGHWSRRGRAGECDPRLGGGEIIALSLANVPHRGDLRVRMVTCTLLTEAPARFIVLPLLSLPCLEWFDFLSHLTLGTCCLPGVIGRPEGMLAVGDMVRTPLRFQRRISYGCVLQG